MQITNAEATRHKKNNVHNIIYKFLHSGGPQTVARRWHPQRAGDASSLCTSSGPYVQPEVKGKRACAEMPHAPHCVCLCVEMLMLFFPFTMTVFKSILKPLNVTIFESFSWW